MLTLRQSTGSESNRTMATIDAMKQYSVISISGYKTVARLLAKCECERLRSSALVRNIECQKTVQETTGLAVICVLSQHHCHNRSAINIRFQKERFWQFIRSPFIIS